MQDSDGNHLVPLPPVRGKFYFPTLTHMRAGGDDSCARDSYR